jgi:hypothetical protein
MSFGPTQNGAQQTSQVLTGLLNLLAQHSHERVVVVGTTCTGKTTMLANVPEGRDQDAEVFPRLTAEESTYVCQVPWTPEIGRTMVRLVRERVESEIGRPLFGTVVIDADFVVLLKISDELLRVRVASRDVRFQDAKSMQAQIEQEVRDSGIPWIEFSVG